MTTNDTEMRRDQKPPKVTPELVKRLHEDVVTWRKDYREVTAGSERMGDGRKSLRAR